MTPLKIIALEAGDVPIVSAHLQDAVVTEGDFAYDARHQRFAMMCNRFVAPSAAARKIGPSTAHTGERRRAALRIERVIRVQKSGFVTAQKPATFAVLAIVFTQATDPADAPSGIIDLICAGGASFRLTVECVEMALEDLGPAWAAKATPDHGQG